MSSISVDGCPYCELINTSSPFIRLWWPDAVVIAPRHPVTAGHVCIAPRTHIVDFSASDDVSAMLARRVAQYRRAFLSDYAANVISSAGSAATQTVMHYHVHVIPRRTGDGIKLPWST
jgi:histidine triad (HIT) family protein